MDVAPVWYQAAASSPFDFLSLLSSSTFLLRLPFSPLSFSPIQIACQRIYMNRRFNSPPPQQPSTICLFFFIGLLPPHRFPLLSNINVCLLLFGWLWMFMDVFWMAFWNFDFFHTGPCVGAHTTSHRARWYHIYTHEYYNDKRVYL